MLKHTLIMAPFSCLQLQRCQQTIEQLRVEKDQVTQQCHDLQQELAMETEHHQEMSEEVKRLKKELNSRFIKI